MLSPRLAGRPGGGARTRFVQTPRHAAQAAWRGLHVLHYWCACIFIAPNRFCRGMHPASSASSAQASVLRALGARGTPPRPAPAEPKRASGAKIYRRIIAVPWHPGLRAPRAGPEWPAPPRPTGQLAQIGISHCIFPIHFLFRIILCIPRQQQQRLTAGLLLCDNEERMSHGFPLDLRYYNVVV